MGNGTWESGWGIWRDIREDRELRPTYCLIRFHAIPQNSSVSFSPNLACFILWICKYLFIEPYLHICIYIYNCSTAPAAPQGAAWPVPADRLRANMTQAAWGCSGFARAFKGSLKGPGLWRPGSLKSLLKGCGGFATAFKGCLTRKGLTMKPENLKGDLGRTNKEKFGGEAPNTPLSLRESPSSDYPILDPPRIQ